MKNFFGETKTKVDIFIRTKNIFNPKNIYVWLILKFFQVRYGTGKIEIKTISYMLVKINYKLIKISYMFVR